MNDITNLQIRKTHDDVLRQQHTMRELVKKKINNNDVLHHNEYETWMRTVSYALMSWGKNTKAFYETPLHCFHLGSVHTFALRFLDWDNPIVLLSNGCKKKYKVEIKMLWSVLYEYMMQVFPLALDEAIHMSKESEKHERSGSFQFSASKKIE
jgi:hypothetical protein